MQSSIDPTPLLGGEVPLDHVVLQPIQPLVAKVVMMMQSLTDPTPLLRCEVPLDHVVGMFYRQHMLVIDGKYNNDDGLSTVAMINNTVIIGEEQQP
jgi:hypothetical protein